MRIQQEKIYKNNIFNYIPFTPPDAIRKIGWLILEAEFILKLIFPKYKN
jgi:hypothetical protein